MSSFPLLKAPILFVEQAWKYMRFPEIVHFSQCSEKCRKITLELQRRETDAICDITVEPLRVKFTICKGGLRFTWLISTTIDPTAAEIRDFKIRTIDGVVFKIAEGKNYWLIVAERANFERELHQTIKVLLKYGNFKVHSVHLDLTGEVEIWNLLRNVNIFFTAKEIYFHPCALSYDEMRFFLDSFSADSLKFHGNAGPRFTYVNDLNFQMLELHGADWLDMRNMASIMRVSRRVELHNVTWFDSNSLYELMSLWMQSDSRTLQLMRINRDRLPNLVHGVGTPPEMTFNRIFGRLPLRQGAKKRPDAAPWFDAEVEYENGQDLHRSDGAIATLLIAYEELRIIVWYDGNPNL